MSMITITSGEFCQSEEIVSEIAKKLNYTIIRDNEIIEATSTEFNIKPSVLNKVLESKNIAFNDFTHEREKCIACLKKTVADHTLNGNCIFYGITSHLIPRYLEGVLHVLIISDKHSRIQNGIKRFDLSEKESSSRVSVSDKIAALWINSLTGKKPWDESLYDLVIPSDQLDEEATPKLIIENLEMISQNKTDNIMKEKSPSDFALAAEAEMKLAAMGGDLSVIADEGNITVTINKNVLMLNRFKEKIIKTVSEISGVKKVETKIGKNFYKANIIHNYEFDTPLNVLLVDDEKEFVQTLSERLKMRHVKSDVVFNGQDAIEFSEANDTDVMVLDLKMPGIDGFEVLKKVKATNPEIEVIILTGHGTEDDRKICMELGAFAYLQKPADIELLTSTMKRAYEKINSRNN